MNEKNEKFEPQGRMEKPLTDLELARLMRDDLDPSERAALVARLADDPDGSQVLALAASPDDASGRRLSNVSIDRFARLVNAKSADTSICVFCAGDLTPGRDFCPYCGARVTGNVLACIKCGKPVREDGSWCPHCGCSFRQVERKPLIETSVLVLSFGTLAIILAFIFRPIFIPLFGIGVFAFGLWAGDVVSRKQNERKAEVEEKRVRDEDEKRKTG